MLIKMLLEKSGAHERSIVRGLLKHVIIGFGAAFLIGLCGYGAILISLAGNEMLIPPLFALAMLLQAGAVGGLVGAGVFMSRVADRSGD